MNCAIGAIAGHERVHGPNFGIGSFSLVADRAGRLKMRALLFCALQKVRQ
jgi:hypothetical protein